MFLDSLPNLIIVVFVIFFSVIIHEISHGWMALALGDKTAKNLGRLSLNPIRHVDPFGSILLPLITTYALGFPFGYAKPVPINPMYFKNQRTGMVYTSLAGPFSNFGLAIIGAGLLKITFNQMASSVLQLFVVLNVLLAVFNLLPIPPLDGSKVVAGVIPHKWLASYYRIESYGIFIVLIIMLFFQKEVWRVLSAIVNPILGLLGVSFGV